LTAVVGRGDAAAAGRAAVLARAIDSARETAGRGAGVGSARSLETGSTPRATSGNDTLGRRPKPSIPIASAATQARATTPTATAAYRNRRARRSSVATKTGRSVGVVTTVVIDLSMPDRVV
jgi:hypothetical protein